MLCVCSSPSNIYNLAFCLFRGQTFRTVLDRIGEVRSILPDGLNIMALTATATKTLRYSVSRTIGMHNPFVIAIAPCKKNIMYSVQTFESVEITFKPVVDRLKGERISMPRMIIYGRSFGVPMGSQDIPFCFFVTNMYLCMEKKHAIIQVCTCINHGQLKVMTYFNIR